MSARMDFFDYQDKARKNTGRLIVLFGLAVAGIILATYLVVSLFVVIVVEGHTHKDQVSRHGAEYEPAISTHSLWQPPLLAGVGFGVIATVVTATLIKLGQLRSGGRAVAESLGASAVDASIAGPQERKIINIVEEMAIASGVPVPPVYILDEGSINAFAAGYTTRDAVVAVTRGSVERLTRDELQGVVGHEFSHILNGDMRLNIQLIGVLHGILAIGIVGKCIVQMAAESSGRTYRRSSKDSGGGRLLFIALGAALIIIGYVGTFFGNLIKAAVSRQREYLADASSVQFTRNPLGLAGALKKIGGHTRGSRIENAAAAQVSHMFFSQAVVSWLDVLMATHPPLAERVRRIDPAWDGQFLTAEPVAPEPTAKKKMAKPIFRPEIAGIAAMAGAEVAGGAATAARVAQLSEAHIADAASLIEQLPESIKAAAHEPFTARALVYAMLINTEAKPQDLQLTYLRDQAERGTAAETQRLLADVRAMDERYRLPALDLAMPALKRLSQSQFITFRDCVASLAAADEKEELFEWMLRQVVLHNLETQFGQAKPPSVRFYGLGRLTKECSLLLSTLAYLGHRDIDAARAAFAAGVRCLDETTSSLPMIEAKACHLDALEDALNLLNQVAPKVKRKIVQACSATVLADQRVTVREAELLRGILAILGCPLTPFDAAE